MKMMDIAKTSVQPDEILEFLKRDIQFKDLCQKILSKKVIERAAIERGITVTPDEIQAEGDGGVIPIAWKSLQIPSLG